MLLTSIMHSQSICDGLTTIPITTFDLCNYNPWTLVFEDNFDGNSLDLTKWSYGPRIRYCNNEQQYYTSGDNIEISNGTLKLIAKEETVYAKADDNYGPYDILECNGNPADQNLRYFYYTSANIETIQKFTYGKFEARVKIPKGKGFWPAFWVYGQNPIYNEIDIFEFWNEYTLGIYDPLKLSKVHHMNITYDYDGDGNPSSCPTKNSMLFGDFSQDFHIFSAVWDKYKIDWYVDDNLIRSDYRYITIDGQITNCTIEAWHEYILNKIYPKDPMQIILNFAIQSGEDSPNENTNFPSQMEVDWVRYYQKLPCQNIYITDASQYPLEDQLYNVIVGNSINFDCDYSVSSNQFLLALANTSIHIGPGFTANYGSTFLARIDPTICSPSLKSTTDNDTHNTFFSENNNDNQIANKNFEAKNIPNISKSE